ncbi:MAG: phage holin family protein [Candidatus Margulisbacteria bacterium]|nr:phage holin family protein [Candidatus Margulisiibacteriota bacterium]
MSILILRWALGALALYLTSRIIKGIYIRQTTSAFIAVAVIALVNILIRPILFLLTLPFTIITLGLFLFILNGFMFYLVARLVDGFEVQTFWDAVAGAFLFSIISYLLNIWLIPSSIIIINSL